MLTPLPLSGSLEQHRSSGSTCLCGGRDKGGNKLYLTKTRYSKEASCTLKGSGRCCTFEMVTLSSVIILQVDRGTEILAEPNILKHQRRIHVVDINTRIHRLNFWSAETTRLWVMLHLSLKPTSQVCQLNHILNTSIPLHCLQWEPVVTAPHQTSITSI